MNSQLVLHIGSVHLPRQSHIFVSCLSVYFNTYQLLRLFLQKGIRGWNVGEVDKYSMYSSRKPLAQALAPQSQKIAILNRGETVKDRVEHFAVVVQGIIYIAVLSGEFSFGTGRGKHSSSTYLPYKRHSRQASVN